MLICSSTLPVAAWADDTSNWTVTGNAGLFSDYKFRGYSQTNNKPAFQGGVDLAHSSGFYVGNWNSNVEQGLYNGASLEMDFYGGYKGTIGDFSYDIGNLYYYYPGSGSNGTTRLRNDELYIGGGYGPIAIKAFYSLTKFFEIGKAPSYQSADTKGSVYLDLSAAQPLDDVGLAGWTANAHVGYQKVQKYQRAYPAAPSNDTVDWKVGVTKDFSGWLGALSLVGTTERKFFTTADSGFTKGAGKIRPVLSVSKTF